MALGSSCFWLLFLGSGSTFGSTLRQPSSCDSVPSSGPILWVYGPKNPNRNDTQADYSSRGNHSRILRSTDAPTTTATFKRLRRRIVATVRNWSDTATFVLESEVFRSQLTDVTENSHPIILGRGLNFTLPATAQGPSIQAEVDGTEVVFPLGPNAVLSWATCEIRTGSERNRTFRCDLKPGYAFKKDESP